MTVIVNPYRFAVAGGGGGGWTPASLGSLYAWYDAADAASITASAGDVSQWNDKSGNARHVTGSGSTKPNTGTRTQNGLNALDFALNDTLVKSVFSLVQPFTVFAVVMMDSRFGADRYIDGYEGSTGGRALLHTNTNVWNVQAGSAASTGRTPTIGSAVQQTTVFDGSASLFRENGTQYGGALNPGTGGLPRLNVATDGVGGGQWDGLVCELFFCSAAISGTDRTSAESYLKTKWGTP